NCAEAKFFLRLPLDLEGECPSKDAAIEFGQHHMHGEVGRGQSSLVRLPRLAPCSGDDDLEYRCTCAVKQCIAAGFRTGSEGGGGYDRRRLEFRQRRFGKGKRIPFLQTGNEDGNRSDTFLTKRLGERVYRRRIRGQQHRAVEEDGNDRPVLLLQVQEGGAAGRSKRLGPVCDTVLLGARPLYDSRSRLIIARLRHLYCRERIDVMASQPCHAANQRPHIVWPPGPKTGQQRLKLHLRQGRGICEAAVKVAVL